MLWAELVIFIFSGDYTFSLAGGVTVFGAFLLSTTVWVAVRQPVASSVEMPDLKRKLNRFQQSTEVFESLIKRQPTVHDVTIPNEMLQGNLAAPLTLVLVSNPVCKFCAAAHAKIEELLNVHSDKLKVLYRFNVNPKNKESVSYQVLSKIFKLHKQSLNGRAFRALSDWYEAKSSSQVLAWNKKCFDIDEEGELVEQFINQNYEWCRKATVTHTPTVFLNNKKLPEEFSLDDLEYYIGKMGEGN